MKFDEFLLSNEIGYQFDTNYIIKLKFNDTIDFLYMPTYGKFEYDDNLKFLGLFDKEHKQLYGSSYHFNYGETLHSSYYKGNISAIQSKVFEDASNLLKNYISENKQDLMKSAKYIFDKYMLVEGNNLEIKNQAIKDYIYQQDKIQLEFLIYADEYKGNMKELIISYLQNPQEISHKIYCEYINNKDKVESYRSRHCGDPDFKITKKELIGLRLLERKYKDELAQELKDNPNNKYKKKYDIINAIKDLDAQMITLTLKHNGETITIKYPRKQLYNFNFRDWHIPDVKSRKMINELYKNINGFDDFLLEDIVSIQYSRKVLYEDKSLLNKDLIAKNEYENPDIVDEMFD